MHVYMYLCAENYEEEKYLWWNHASTHDKDIWPSQGSKFFDKLRDKGFVTSSKRADAHSMYICIHGLLSHFPGSLSTQKQRQVSGYMKGEENKALGYLRQCPIILTVTSCSLIVRFQVVAKLLMQWTTNTVCASGTGIHQLKSKLEQKKKSTQEIFKVIFVDHKIPSLNGKLHFPKSQNISFSVDIYFHKSLS